MCPSNEVTSNNCTLYFTELEPTPSPTLTPTPTPVTMEEAKQLAVSIVMDLSLDMVHTIWLFVLK